MALGLDRSDENLNRLENMRLSSFALAAWQTEYEIYPAFKYLQ